jgi:ATP-dependent Clp protease ATP-binding subunit ClpA
MATFDSEYGTPSATQREKEAYMAHMTVRAEQVVELAKDEAARLGRKSVAPEHLLLALTKQTDSMTSAVLARLNITYQKVLDALTAEVSEADELAARRMREERRRIEDESEQRAQAAAAKSAVRREDPLQDIEETVAKVLDTVSRAAAGVSAFLRKP